MWQPVFFVVTLITITGKRLKALLFLKIQQSLRILIYLKKIQINQKKSEQFMKIYCASGEARLPRSRNIFFIFVGLINFQRKICHYNLLLDKKRKKN